MHFREIKTRIEGQEVQNKEILEINEIHRKIQLIQMELDFDEVDKEAKLEELKVLRERLKNLEAKIQSVPNNNQASTVSAENEAYREASLADMEESIVLDLETDLSESIEDVSIKF